jgi:oligopeptide/dipeptide ABC transporter ATP-binding protein
VADEPTSALDTVSQQQLAELFLALHEKRGVAVLFISHDLRLVGRLAERVIVLYAGETVETAAREEVFANPLHPYTRALLQALPRPAGGARQRFPTIAGRVPRAGEWPAGCRFAPRCPLAFDRGRLARPAISEPEPGRRVRCFLFSDQEEPGADR